MFLSIFVLTRNILKIYEQGIFTDFFGLSLTILQIHKKVTCFKKINEAMKKGILLGYQNVLDILICQKFWENS